MQQARLSLLAAALLASEASAFSVGGARGARHNGAVGRASARPVQMQDTAEAESVAKRDERRRIMGKDKYKRGGAPFDKAIHKDVTSKMSEKFKSELVEQMKEDSFRELKRGEGNGEVTFVLAKEYGFCWGVERSIELAWAARDAYPEKKMHITNEVRARCDPFFFLRGRWLLLCLAESRAADRPLSLARSLS